MEMEMARMNVTARRRGREHGGMTKEATAEEERLASRDETWSFVIVLSLEGRRCDRFIYTDHRRHRRQKLNFKTLFGFFSFFYYFT